MTRATGWVVAVLVDVPVRAARVPDGASQGVAQFGVEGVGGLAADLDPGGAGAAQLAQRGQHVRIEDSIVATTEPVPPLVLGP